MARLLTVNGVLVVAQNDVLTMDDPTGTIGISGRILDNVSILNYGTIYWREVPNSTGTLLMPAGDLNMMNQATIINDGSFGQGAFFISTGDSIVQAATDLKTNPLPTIQIVNKGLVQNLGSALGAAGTIAVPVKNKGGTFINAAGQRIALLAGYDQTDGATQLAAGSILTVTGTFEQDGGTTALTGGTLTVAGDLVENGGTVTLSAGTVDAANVDVAAGAVFSGDGAVTANVNNAGEVDTDASGSPLAVSGAYTQTAGVTNVVSGSALSVTGLLDEQYGVVNLLDGGLEADGGYHVDSGASLTGDGQITANVTNAGQVNTAGISPLAVSGVYVQTAGVTNVVNGSALSVIGVLDEQAGVLNLNGGSLQVNGGYTVESGAILNGSGTLTADVTNDGTIQVGGANSIGGLTTAANSSAGVYGNLTETATAALDMAIAGAMSYDTLSVAGATTLGGTLNVQLLDNFMPTPGEWFSLLPDMTSGQFAALNLPGLSGETFVPEYNAPNHPGFSLLVLGTTSTYLSSSSGYYDPTSAPGQPVTFTATVYSYDGAALAGAVQFYDNGVELGAPVSVTAVSDGMPGYYQWQASYTASDLALGTNVITASYLGDPVNAASNSNPVNQTVQLASTSIYLSSTSGYYDPTSAPGQAVTFTATVYSDYSGASLTGAVQFYDNGVALGAPVSVAAVSDGMPGYYQWQASYTTADLALGTNTITASYLGDPVFAASASNAVTQTVQLASTSTYLSSSSGYYDPTLAPGQGVTFTADVSGNYAGAALTGAVQFYDNGVALGAPVSVAAVSDGMPGYYQWQASFTTSDLALGSHSIVAVYQGDTGDLGSTSNALTQTVQLASTSTYLTSSSGYYDPTSAPGQPVIFTATVYSYDGTALTGAVQFYDNGVALGAPVSVAAVSDGMPGYYQWEAAFTTSDLALGSHSIVAVYQGDVADAGSTSNALTETIQ